MGRRKIYVTEEQKKTANNQKVKDFYWRNKRRLDLEANLRYWKKELSSVNENTDPKRIKKINANVLRLESRLSILKQQK